MPKNLYGLLIIILLMGVGSTYGQQYSFKVKYGMVHAGKAEMIHVVENGILTSTLNIESSPWLSNLWVLSDSIWSTYDLELNRLKRHIKAIHEGGYHRNYEVDFLEDNIVQVNQNIRQLDSQDFKDIPSLLFELSHTKLTVGDTLYYRLWDGKSYGVLNLLIDKAPKPSLFRPFTEQGWKLTPLNSTRKSRENQIQLSLLLSQSIPHLPLKIQINTKYGGVLMRLERP